MKKNMHTMPMVYHPLWWPWMAVPHYKTSRVLKRAQLHGVVRWSQFVARSMNIKIYLPPTTITTVLPRYFYTL